MTSTAASGSASDSGTTGLDTLDGTTSDGSGTGPTGPVCGDGMIEGDEACDEGAANGNGESFCRDNCVANDCGDGYVGPGEACDDGNIDDEDRCTNDCGLASCGDGMVQAGEECDEGMANSETGACLRSCLNATCGDQFIQAGVEACDADDVGGEDCMSQNFDGGVLLCETDCLTFNTSGCYVCGDGAVELGVEECDDDDLNGMIWCDTLPGQTFNNGVLACDKSCTFDTSDCSECSNNVLEGSEICDGNQLGGADCMSQGFFGGTLACNPSCTLDTSGCTNCGNGVIDAGEDCDLAEFDGEDCTTVPGGFAEGNLACDGSCVFDTSDCSTCGNDVIEGSEICDGTDFGGQTCPSGGDLECSANCDMISMEACCLADGEDCDFPSDCCSISCGGGSAGTPNTCQPL